MMLRERMIPCQSREAVVTVLSYQSGVLEGYMQHPSSLNSPLPFVTRECNFGSIV